ncbi:helix-turn-helix domain-containing protein, partial [Corynebacterium senegalense]|uniref:helix-turn-helix domain-containing protein n=1 Tax=Corynebacterium senegalense TaxID=2080750 RepID=UPI0011C07492
MSVKAVAWVLDDLQGLKPGPTLVMLALADFADERNSCFPGQERIAARARCSKRSVINYLRELQELGLISVESRTYSQGRGSIRRTSNRYILHVGKTYSLESAQSAPAKKPAGKSEDAESAPSNFQSAETRVSKVQPVAPKEPSVKEPPVPPTPEGGRAAQPPGASPAGEAWEEELFWTDRLASIALASIGQRPMPENVTEDELAA